LFVFKFHQVILTNDLTTVVNEKGTEVVPALGETFAHRVQYRLLLSKTPGCPNGYTALLTKSSERARRAARFTVSVIFTTPSGGRPVRRRGRPARARACSPVLTTDVPYRTPDWGGGEEDDSSFGRHTLIAFENEFQRDIIAFDSFPWPIVVLFVFSLLLRFPTERILSLVDVINPQTAP